MAQSLLAAGDSREAVEAARRAIACEPDDDWGYRVLALAQLATGAIEPSIAAATQAVKLSPQSPSALYVLGTCQLDAGQLQAASATAEQLRASAPSDRASYELLCRVALRYRGWSAAIQNAKRALVLDPQSAVDWNNLGAAYQGQRRRFKAMRTYIRTLQIDPSQPTARRNLRRLVMPLADDTSGRAWAMLLLAPFWLPRTVFFSVALRRRLPSRVRTEFFAEPITALEVTAMVVAIILTGALAFETGLASWLFLFIAASVASVTYAAVRLVDTLRWWRSRRRRLES